MYHHFDRKNQLFIMRYIPSHLHEILFSKLPSGGGICSKPLSHLQHTMDFSMIHTRLAASNLSKPDSNHSVVQYSSTQEFIDTPNLAPCTAGPPTPSLTSSAQCRP